MARTIASRRPEILVVLFLAGYLASLSLQIKRGERTLLGGVALALFSPVLTVFHEAQRFTREGADAYLWQKDAAVRNEALERENLFLKEREKLYESQGEENARLRRLLDIPPPTGFSLVAGRALMRYGEPFGRYLLVSCDTAASVFPNTPVLVPEGLVGKVQGASGGFYRVILTTDPSSAVGVTCQRTQVHGVAVGDGRLMNVRYVTNESDVKEEDVFVTSGEDGVFPPGIPVGTVTSVTDGGDFLKRIVLKPAVSMDSLSWVVMQVRGHA